MHICGGKMSEVDFAYGEQRALEEALNYIKSTYQQHYVNPDGVQLMDLFFADPDEGMVFCKTNAIKYLSRFGKKQGNNKKDLLKAIHYVVLMMHCVNKMEKIDNGNDTHKRESE